MKSQLVNIQDPVDALRASFPTPHFVLSLKRNGSLKNLEKEICLLFPCTPGVGALRKGRGLPCLRGMSQNQSLPGTAPWTLGLGSMPCDQMAVIAGNPRPCRRVAYGCLQRPGPRREHQNGRLSGGQSEHIPEKGEVPARGKSPAQVQIPTPSTRHSLHHTQGKQSSNLRVPPHLLCVSIIASASEQCSRGSGGFYSSLSWSAREPRHFFIHSFGGTDLNTPGSL